MLPCTRSLELFYLLQVKGKKVATNDICDVYGLIIQERAA